MTKTRDLANLIADSKVGPSEIDTTGTYNMNALQVGGTTVINSSRAVTADGLTVDTNTLHVDATNNRVGIGTNSPSTRLTVGAGVSSEEIRVDAGAGWADLTLNSNATNGGHIYFNDGSNAGEIFYYHPYDYMAFNTAGAEAMRIGSAGNVGLGTTSTAGHSNHTNLFLGGTGNIYAEKAATADASLHISQNAHVDTDGSWEYRVTDEATNYYQYAGTHVWRYAASGTAGNDISWSEAMRIDASGRVGIGITPAAVSDSTGADSLQLGGTFLIHYDEDGPGTTTLGNNIYYNGTANKALFTGATSQYYQAGGTHVWRNSGSTSAGSTTTMSESMRITSAGHLLVGKTSTAFGTDGTHINNSGYLEVTNTSGELLYLNRLSNDGDLIRLFKDSAQVGSIASNSGYLKINSGNTSFGSGIEFHNLKALPVGANGASSNGTVSLGESGRAWKDLHLSGSIEIENGTGNVGVGKQALNSNSANENTAVGYQAGYSQTSGGYYNTYMGYASGYSNTGGDFNTYYGYQSGYSNQGGTGNTYIGKQAGYLMSGGNYNTILGGYNGNEGGLDIRTSSNRIVLSDGDGNPRIYVDGGGMVRIGQSLSTSKGGYLQVVRSSGGDQTNDNLAYFETSGNDWVQTLNYNNATGVKYFVQFKDRGTTVGSIRGTTSTTSYNTSSDYRLKENVVDLTGATDRLKQLNPSRFNFIVDADTTVDGFLAHEVQSVVPEAITGTHNEVDADGNPVYQGIDQSKLVPLLVATIKELEARITALENA